MNEFTEKIRSLGFLRSKGQSRTRVIRNEDTGGVAGRETDYWDDRVDAVATPATVKFKLKKED